MSFQVIDLETEEPLRLRGAIRVFQTGTEAAAVAKDATESTGKRHKPRRLTNDEWKCREQQRFENGTYLRLPDSWVLSDWWQLHADIWRDHFPHVALADQTRLSFTESPEKGVADIQTRIKPGKYLQRFFGHLLDGAEIKQYAASFAECFEENRLLLGTTADDFEEVYENGPSSCMQFERKDVEFEGPVHPARVYAAGDLAIAYMKRHGAITARAVVWPEKKIHSRIYGDIDRLKALLHHAGYRWAPPIGAKLSRIPYDNRFVCPYIDAGPSSGTGSLYVRDDGTHLVITDDDCDTYSADNIDGVSNYPPDEPEADWRCENCGDGYSNDAECVRVLIGQHRQQYWCEMCSDNSAIYCDDEESYVQRDRVVCMAAGNYWSDWKFARGGFTSDHDGHNYDASDLVVVNTAYGSKDWTADQAEDDAETCPVTAARWRRGDMIAHETLGLIAPYCTAADIEAALRQKKLPPYHCDDPAQQDIAF